MGFLPSLSALQQAASAYRQDVISIAAKTVQQGREVQ